MLTDLKINIYKILFRLKRTARCMRVRYCVCRPELLKHDVSKCVMSQSYQADI